MKKENIQPWWHRYLRGIGIVLGLLGLVAVMMAGIILTARYLVINSDSGDAKIPPAVFIDLTPPKGVEQNTAMTRTPGVYEVPWQNSPGRPAGYIASGGRSGGSGVGAGSGPPPAARANVPTGVSVEEFRATVESGKKVYLPNPKGECDLSGTDLTKSTDALDNCLAQQAAR